jgi:hypothetical protein
VVIVKEAGGLDEMAASWLLVTLIFLFMFAIGVSVSNFPWVLMGEEKSSWIWSHAVFQPSGSPPTIKPWRQELLSPSSLVSFSSPSRQGQADVDSKY